MKNLIYDLFNIDLFLSPNQILLNIPFCLTNQVYN